MAPKDMRDLLRVLAERDISVNESDIATAFESSKTRREAAEWVQEYLQPSTLLTKEELSFYERHGIKMNSSQSGVSRAMSEQELETAMDSLDASTAALERQCEMMEKQKVALRKLQARNGVTTSDRNEPLSRKDKFAREKGQLDFDIAELSSATVSLLQASIKQIESATRGVPSNVDRLLEKDDRLLDGLQKLLPKLSDSASDVDGAEEVERLCTSLSALSIQEIHGRLDRVYRDSISDYSRKRTPQKDFTEQQAKQRETLRAELQELGGEIDGLVGIVVDHQYRKSLKQGLLSARADAKVQKARWSEYTVSALLYLISRLDAIGEHIQRLHAHDSTLRAVSETLDKAIESEQTSASARNPTSQTPDKAGAKGLKPLRLVQANLSEAQDPAVTFLKEHDIRISDISSADKLAPILLANSRELDDKLSRLATRTEAGVADVLAQSFAKTQGDLQELRRAVLAHTRYAGIRLVDPDVQARMDDLERDTQKLGDAMRELDVDAIAKATKDRRQEVVQKLVT